MAQATIEVDGIELATESFGDPSDPPLLLIMGMGASMVWWEDDFCRSLAAGGRFVIRYDHRDTGRSTSYEPGHPRYGSEELVTDAGAVLDGYQIPAAHVIGLSMGGALAQLVALEFPARVTSLTLISTTFAVSSGRELPPPARSYTQFLRDARVDWDDAQSVIEYVVDHWRALSPTTRPFDEHNVRGLATRDVQRARNFASARNHGLLAGEPPDRPVSAIGVPTLVIHGTADPLCGLEHGQALSEKIPGARLLVLEGAGHGLQRPDWAAVRSAILAHTGGMPA
jgi:pimeloyl-ACP methyl ester carboxylesterase